MSREDATKRKTVVFATNLDTRGASALKLKELIQAQGHDVILLDFSMEKTPPLEGDITCDSVAEMGGFSIEEVREKYISERKSATDCMIRGASQIVSELVGEGRIHGILGIGGATATLVVTSVMGVLPFGFPKVMATPVAAHALVQRHCAGINDVTMLNTVVDVVGSNPLLDRALRAAVGAICGMVALYPGPAQVAEELSSGRPVIGVTNFGLSELPVQRCLEVLEQAGFQPVPFHAQGRGDRAMDAMIRKGDLAGVIEMVPRGIAEELLGGDCPGGDDRLLAAAEMGLPQVVTPGGMDQLTLDLEGDWRQRFAGRKYQVLDEMRVEIRTLPEECRRVARIVADRLNAASAPFLVLIPTGGFSSIGRKGKALHDPEADAAFVEELLERLADPSRARRVDHELYTLEFGEACASAFLEVWNEHLRHPARR